jgi:hypothetical protein
MSVLITTSLVWLFHLHYLTYFYNKSRGRYSVHFVMRALRLRELAKDPKVSK